MEGGLQDGRSAGALNSLAARDPNEKNREEIVSFASVNYLSIVIAAVVAWLASAVWYTLLGRIWTTAAGKTAEQMHEDRKRPGAYLPFIYVFVADLIIAWTIYGLLMHLGVFTIRGGLISGALCWFGFILTTMVANYTFAQRDIRLLLIDAGNWLVVLLLIGAIVGTMGA
jgi:uncharacterized protein DUF1761